MKRNKWTIYVLLAVLGMTVLCFSFVNILQPYQLWCRTDKNLLVDFYLDYRDWYLTYHDNNGYHWEQFQNVSLVGLADSDNYNYWGCLRYKFFTQ